MGVTSPKRTSYSYAVSVALVVLGMGYLTLTGLYGEFGMMRLLQAEEEAKQRTRELRALEIQQAEIERDIRALSTNSLDLDMLEERLRAVLGWGHRDDLLLTP
jgi:cell division protein FtsB